MWEYYFAYCQVGFETGALTVGLYKIALPMDDARISSIRTSLAELLSMLTSIRKN
jgi:hypothetical protein